LTDGTMVTSAASERQCDRTAKDFASWHTRSARCCAAYFPETNVLVPLDSTAKTSNTPDLEIDHRTTDPG